MIPVHLHLIAAILKLLTVLRGKAEKFFRETIKIPDMQTVANLFHKFKIGAEHIADPEFVASELLRILRPGGYICARTANRFGYVKLIAQIIPNSLHVAFLRRIQPGRQSEDVFPTVYKLNSKSQVKNFFRNCDVYSYFDSAEPAYHFGSRILYAIFAVWHKIMPEVLATSVCFFIRKR